MPAIPRLEKLTIPFVDRFKPLSLREGFSTMDGRLRSGRLSATAPVRTGFVELDHILGGGLKSEDLVVAGGKQNSGKTIFVMQAGLQAVELDETLLVIYFCYEHGLVTLLYRLLCMVSRAIGAEGRVSGVSRDDIEGAIRAYYHLPEHRRPHPLDIHWLIQHVPGLERAWWRLEPLLDRMWIVTADSAQTTLDWLDQYVTIARHYGNERIMLIVDYAQRVPVSPVLARAGLSTDQQIDLVIRGLKGLAMTHEIVVLAVAAADHDGVRQFRVHIENLWGPSTIQYEPDTGLIINKESAEENEGIKRIRIAVEKSRHGRSDVEYWHDLYGAYYSISEGGILVPDELSYQNERLALQAPQADTPLARLEPQIARLILLATIRMGAGLGETTWAMVKSALTADDGGVGRWPDLVEILEQAAYRQGSVRCKEVGAR